MGRILRFLLFAALTATLHAQTADPGKTVIVVRHAERASQERDSPLSKTGEARAQCLAGMLADAGVKAAFSSEFKRTQQTIAPTMEKAKVAPVAVPGAKTDELLRQIREANAPVILVAGHSDTVPFIVKALTGQDVPAIGHDEYDRMYIVDASAKRALLIRYCTAVGNVGQ